MLKTKQVILMTVMCILFLPVLTLAGAVDLPKTGQTTCYDSAGNVIACAGTGQDGDIQAGVAWPNPRFTNNGDGTVTDNLTGLMWTQDGNAPGPVECSPGVTKTWQLALDYVACLNTNSYLGYNDWRLTNILELDGIINDEKTNPATWLISQGFINVQSNNYWSSTSSDMYSSHAWVFSVLGNFYGSYMYYDVKNNHNYVWPVRSGKSGVAQLWETGQTSCYNSSLNVIACSGTGQDGELQAGVPWPSPRFSVSGDCVTDNLTGLMWTKDTNLSGGGKTWQQALGYVSSLNLCGYSDWRLPDRKELVSLIDFSQYNPALPSGHPFLNVQFLAYPHYWSSTTYAGHSSEAWIIYWGDGHVDSTPKSENSHYVWPVRSARDLVVSSLSAPFVTAPGQSILLSDTTKNQGTATADASTTKYYWPANPNPVLLGSRSVPALAPGEISSGTTSVTIPSFTCSGMKTFYIKATADADGVITESDETNNSRSRAIKMGPDLTVSVLTAPINAGAGKTINISDTTKNNGGCTGGASTTKFYLSADTLWDSGDVLLGSRAVPSLISGATSLGSTAVTIPAGTATGKYYLIAWSDADNVVAETNEGNNKKVRVINIIPDLIVSILSAPNTAGAGATITISDTTKNIGGSTAAASTTKFYFSTDTTYDTGDTLLGSRSIPSLAAGATDSGSTSVTIPIGTTSGAYYIIGRADADAVVAETNESNNNKYRMITVP